MRAVPSLRASVAACNGRIALRRGLIVQTSKALSGKPPHSRCRPGRGSCFPALLRALGDDKSGHGDAVEKQQSIGTPDSSQAGGDDDAQAGNMGNRFASVRRTREQGGNCASPEEAQHMLEADVSEAMSSVDPIQLVALSVGFYGAMTAAAIALGEANGGMGIAAELLRGWDIPAGLGFLVPFILGLLAAVKYSDEVPALAQMRDGYKKTLVPLLSASPAWGHCIMALGAAVGEEALFRGFMQSSVLALLPLDANLGGGVSIAITSLVFGVLHMTSPASFIWATAGGVILGLEYQVVGLGAAVITHWLYDWFAFYYICRVWGSTHKSSNKGGASS